MANFTGLLHIDGAEKIETSLLVDDCDNGSQNIPEVPMESMRGNEDLNTETISLEDQMAEKKQHVSPLSFSLQEHPEKKSKLK